MNDPSATPPRAIEAVPFDAIPALRGTDVDCYEAGPSLPVDHPAWQRDVVSISARTRAILATLRPLAIRVMSFWDHRLRELGLGARTLTVDASGCYRLR